MLKKLLLGGVALLAFSPAFTQITQRERPVEWKQLVEGGRFMDRFLPMQKGKLERAAWGADSVRLRYVDNGIEVDSLSFWGGNIVVDSDSVYHMFVCCWPENSPKGHMAWPNSIVYHAVGKNPQGPYTLKERIGKGHNPEIFRLKDGRYVIYVIDGCYLSSSLNGPWVYSKLRFEDRGRRIIEGLSNLTFAARQDGSQLMVCRGGGIWISRTGLSPYMQITDKRVYPPVAGEFEDPVVWRDHLQYHLIVNDWLGRIAFYLRSKDGVNWVTEPGEAYMPGIARHEDGYQEHWFKYERPKVLQDEYGRAVQMNFAVIDTIKWEDHPNDTHSSKNICIPLNKGLLLSVENTIPITSATPSIDVRIKGEADFNPNTDLDLTSLRFGAYTEVNFGRGARVITSRKLGNDLIVTFEGKNSGITPDEFAPKLIGRTRKGKLIYGYASLPYINYTPDILSASYPVCATEKGKKVWEMQVRNLGLSDSPNTQVRLLQDDCVLAEGWVKTLSPYEETFLQLPVCDKHFDISKPLQILFLRDGKEIRKETLTY